MAKKLIPEPEEVFVYIGPTVQGIAQSGTIYTGTRSAVLGKFRAAAERFPQISTLIVKDADVAAARKKIKTGGNALAQAYRSIKNA
jgi:hypothetical protein